ncbi:hypothetical protein [Clostridium sp.]|uniref:hypothetical protein n=1 Tax=Clostridium sp. TaxID=1506 RepID=UPI002A91E16E|nr:hypothetical protein [Clostridium sp.]MDY6011327.1 hypothetical protein [Clostridium sp.]
MHGQIVDINNLEAFVELDDGNLVSVPTTQLSGASIGDHIHLNNCISPNNHNLLKYNTNPFMNDLL